jgi:TRAP-type C4-dicarboxylate transport system permease small subunit
MKKQNVGNWLLLIFFWVLGLAVFAQFFFRYFLNNPLGWTEEIARYLLIGVTFCGSMIAVRKDNHIKVIFFYKYINLAVKKTRIITLSMDVLLTTVYAYLAWLSWRMTSFATQDMSTIPLPKSLIYYWVCFCFVGMTFYSLFAAKKHWKNPETAPIGVAQQLYKRRTEV